MKGKDSSILNKFIACPYDHTNLIQHDTQYQCATCGKIFPVIDGVINFLAHEKEFNSLSYEIPWHPIPSISYRSRIRSTLMKFPVYPRLLITSDYFSFYLERILHTNLKKHRQILDVGCREGTNLLISRSPEICAGIDIDFTAVRFAHKSSPVKSQAHLGSGTAIPFIDNCFDLLICSEVIEHIVEYQKLADNIARVCQKGAKIIITTPNGDITPKPYELHHKHFTKKELISLFSPNFRNIEIKSIARNCTARQKYWNLQEKGHAGKLVMLLINIITNLDYLLKGYHRDHEHRQDVTDANYILTGIRK